MIVRSSSRSAYKMDIFDIISIIEQIVKAQQLHSISASPDY
jgi:hypothetical protein